MTHDQSLCSHDSMPGGNSPTGEAECPIVFESFDDEDRHAEEEQEQVMQLWQGEVEEEMEQPEGADIDTALGDCPITFDFADEDEPAEEEQEQAMQLWQGEEEERVQLQQLEDANTTSGTLCTDQFFAHACMSDEPVVSKRLCR